MENPEKVSITVCDTCDYGRRMYSMLSQLKPADIGKINELEITTTECLGRCNHGPTIEVKINGKERLFTNVASEDYYPEDYETSPIGKDHLATIRTFVERYAS
ncbi:MAG: (2Fe-2S) ferredoxin domain-containing protein [Nanoarchaeota archaeon]